MTEPPSGPQWRWRDGRRVLAAARLSPPELIAATAAGVGALALPAGAAAAVIDADPGLAAIEAALVENMQSWRSLRDFDRCNSRRLELLEQTLAFPLTSDADAATALRVALKACGEDDWANEQVDWGTIGRPEDVIRVNIVRKVQRYLSGEPQEQAQAA